LDIRWPLSGNSGPKYATVARMSATPVSAVPAGASVTAYPGLAAAFALCALATLILLAGHPAPAGHGLVEFVNAQARDRVRDALVHGGFIVTLAALTVCFILLARRVGAGRVPVVVGLVAYGIGCGALILSMIVDGFVVPAIATRFQGVAAAGDLKPAETLFIFCGALVRFLIPLGLLSQAGAMLAWSVVLVGGHGGWRRAAGVFGVIAAVFLAGALLAVPPMLEQHVFLSGIALQSLWYLALAGVLSRTSLA
jgi:hypothetical protein